VLLTLPFLSPEIWRYYLLINRPEVSGLPSTAPQPRVSGGSGALLAYPPFSSPQDLMQLPSTPPPPTHPPVALVQASDTVFTWSDLSATPSPFLDAEHESPGLPPPVALVQASDTVFTWSDLQAKQNNELLKNLGNFINRALAFLAKPWVSARTPFTSPGKAWVITRTPFPFPQEAAQKALKLSWTPGKNLSSFLPSLLPLSLSPSLSSLGRRGVRLGHSGGVRPCGGRADGEAECGCGAAAGGVCG